MEITTMMWIGFAVIMLVVFALDLGVFNRKSHEIKFREALTWTLVWVSLALSFNAWIYFEMGPTKAMEFFTGYLIEQSLSVDNLFVFIMIFTYFHITKVHQPKILKWGIIGALVLRAIFILAGIELIERFHWMIYVFGGILVVTGFKMAFGGEEKIEPEKNPIVRLVRKLVPITKRIRDDRFFIKKGGVRAATPLFLALVMVESSDLIFAVDSIPAVLAVSRDPFIVYTSNVFAIMGLRSLYYLLANVMEMFVYLKLGVSVILAYVGVKMLLVDIYHIPIIFSLGTIVGVLAISILTSVTIGNRRTRTAQRG
ncbi:TerC family protein [Geobacter sulfurreducens]|jgi:tellurite resistance protein TerC|uniref:Membrane protein, TerC family n=1 Tax=Geobacter sulfurreducens (strain ATCC 51573 / DSM 12127 / PCA) TaxID=243231 RepID=Q74EV4_GEOSL|nr:TerC family protein [Geobacter sulfurreducens]AAR34185.1 membrane protein, TerC family [Geobacter sulfurreducens PCA]ADI83697.1 membrane protein, TerC family [Geobacter sulfurreducens KN400]AJY70595.1 integral membrane protein TerC [Geobacter sulfurreducens]UAC04914.1 TerC family protein [Geobacter sulfurreducens]UTG93541.1 TerC family protein [Geobacter sulfurreducens]